MSLRRRAAAGLKAPRRSLRDWLILLVLLGNALAVLGAFVQYARSGRRAVNHYIVKVAVDSLDVHRRERP